MVNVETTTPLLFQEDSLMKDPKTLQDFFQEAKELIEKSKALDVETAMIEILVLERKARQAYDSATVVLLTTYLLERFKEESKWKELDELLMILCKKRGQLKRPIVTMVRLIMSWLDVLPSPEIKKMLFKTLRAITEDKIFVELEKVRLIRIQADDLEKENKIEEAAKLLQDVQVETCNGMETREKTEYILNQLRLFLLVKDYIRCQITSKKLNLKVLDKPEFQDLKLIYYNYMIEYYLHDKNFLNVAKMQWNCFNTPSVTESDQWKQYLEDYVIYLALAPYSEECGKLLSDLSETKKKEISELPIAKHVLDQILSTELVEWPLSVDKQLMEIPIFYKFPDFYEIIKQNFVCHNILILYKYYKRIGMDRAAELLKISTDELECMLSSLVTQDIIYARIDRPNGGIKFGKRQTAQARLNEWSGNISNLLESLQEVTHLISNEIMIQSALKKRAQLIEASKPSI